jgi:glucosamine-6-phosphate deaminase
MKNTIHTATVDQLNIKVYADRPSLGNAAAEQVAIKIKEMLAQKGELRIVCRLQQINDGCFPNFDDVPTHAITLTIPALMSGRQLFCMVPGISKRHAVRKTLNEPISTSCPSSVLREHPACILFTDKDSYKLEVDERGAAYGPSPEK